jgi:hypothetical protein
MKMLINKLKRAIKVKAKKIMKKPFLTKKRKIGLKTLIIMKTTKVRTSNVGSQNMTLKKYPLTMNRLASCSYRPIHKNMEQARCIESSKIY